VNKSVQKLRALRVIAAACGIGGFSVFAQQAAPRPPAQVLAASGEPPQVIVSASRFEETYDDGKTIGITVITAEQIRESGATSIFDVLRTKGGVNARSNLFGTLDDTLDLRGFGVSGDQNTLVLIDGQRISENELQSARLSAVPLGEIDRVEIVRGSGAVLYGGGATAGVINVITKSARAGTRSLNAGLLAGSFGTTDTRIDGSVAGAAVALDFAANRFQTGNFRINSAARQENVSARLRLFGERGEVALRVATERQHARLPGALTAAQYAADRTQTRFPNDYADIDANHVGLSANYRFDNAEVVLDAYRRDKVNRFFNDFGSGANSFTRSGSSVDGVSPRLRVTAPVFGIANQFVAGFDGSRWAYKNEQAAYFPFFIGTPGVKSESDLGGAGLNSDESGRQSNAAYYFKNDMKLGALRVGLGARRESVYQSTANPLGFAPLAATQTEFKLHAEELGMAWALDSRWTVHARLGNSYRVANIDENRNRFPTPGFLLPQTSRDREIGAAYGTRTLDVQVRLFAHRLDNEIQFVFVSNLVSPPFGNGANLNLAPTERSGADVQAAWRLTPNLALSGNFAHVDARFRSGSFSGLELSGKEVPMVPRTRAGAGVIWRPAERDSFNLAWRYVGSQVYDNDQANVFNRLPAYNVFDAKYVRRVGPVDIGISVTNLADRRYASYGVIGNNAASNLYPERPRAVFVSALFRM
jgi:iron complex outermembrane receptor protein